MSTIGSTAPGQHTINYDSLLSTTLFAYRNSLVDNIFKANAFLAALRKYDGITYQDGGERIQIPLMYEESSTVKSYQGYEVIDVTPQDGISSAFYPWCELAGTISISRREERQNSGEAQLLDLLKAKIQQAEMTIKGKVNSQLLQGTVSATTFVPGNSSKDLYPLGYFLPKNNNSDPVSGGNVGNLSRASYSWWRPKTARFDSATLATGNAFGLAVTTYAGFKVGLRRMYNHCSRGADNSGPNLVVFDQNSYETYENALDANVRYMDTELADMGFDNIKLKGAVCIWDELVPDIDSGTTAITKGSAFFINTKFYKLAIDRQTDFITTPFIEPENQTAKTAKILFMGNATLSNPSKCGVCYAIAQTIAA